MRSAITACAIRKKYRTFTNLSPLLAASGTTRNDNAEPTGFTSEHIPVARTRSEDGNQAEVTRAGNAYEKGIANPLQISDRRMKASASGIAESAQWGIIRSKFCSMRKIRLIRVSARVLLKKLSKKTITGVKKIDAADPTARTRFIADGPMFALE